MDIKEIEVKCPWGKIAVKLWGDERHPAILTVHGIMDNAGSFDGIIPLLPDNYFYICIDLPGHGKSSHFPPYLPVYTVNNILVYTMVMDYFKRDKYIIMGHSYGGQLGYLYAQMYPDKVEKLIMLDTVHLITIPADYYINSLVFSFRQYFETQEKLEKGKPPQYTYEEALERVMQGRSFPLTEKAAKALLNRILIPTENGKFEFSIDQRLKRFINPLHDERYAVESMKSHPVNIPILIVFGTDSAVRRMAVANILKYLKKFKNVTIKYVPGDHDVHNTDPERVAPHVVKFLNKKKSKL